MRRALENYESYLNGPDRRALGRFIVPVSRLRELEESASDLIVRARRGGSWHLSVLVSDDIGAAAEEIAAFNRRHSPASERGSAVIDVVELKATKVEDVGRQQKELPDSLTAYFEIPLGGDVPRLVGAIGSAGARAKMRTGGVTPEAFP